MKIRKSILLLIVGFWTSAASACTEPTVTVETLWIIDHGSTGGVTNFWVGLEVNVFPPTTVPLNCVSGIGFSGPAVPSLSVTDVMVSVANPNTPGIGVPIPEFNNLNPDAAASNLLDNIDPGNAPWFGFSGLIPPFVPPPLAGGDVYKLWMDVFVDDADVPAFLANSAMFAGGTDPLLPPFDAAHPIIIGSATDPLLGSAMVHGDGIVPEPSGIALLLLGSLALLFGRRRKRKRV